MRRKCSRPSRFAAAATRRRRGLRTRRGAGVLTVLLAALLLWPGPAHPQFTGDFTLGKHLLETENFLDWKAYQHPYAWRQELATAPNSFDGTAGSLSQRNFYFFEEIRLEKSLGRYASVHYFQQQDAFFRPDPSYQEIELRFGRGVYASVLGFPNHEKTDTHLGFALAWGQRPEDDYLRYTRVSLFRLYNKETLGLERYARGPVLDRLEARTVLGERVTLQLQWREERPTERTSPDPADPAQGTHETYQGRKWDGLVDVRWSPRLSTGLSARSLREWRTRAPLAPAGAPPDAAQALEWGTGDLYAVVALPTGDVLEGGVYRGVYRNTIGADALSERLLHHLLTDALYGLWTHRRSEWFQWLFSLQAGRVALLTTDPAAPQRPVDERSTQVKGAVGVVLQEPGSYRVLFNSTWDLDTFGQREWDGGNVQLLFLF